MKRFYYSIVMAVIIAAAFTSCGTSQAVVEAAAPQVNVSIGFNDFYGALNPYGRWVEYGTYGRVWICSEAGFVPYRTGGRWVYTDYGWTWVSSYDWGWAPFHYGRWIYEGGWGWMWVPGYEWAPAWVGWRSGGGYYGWAPLAPGISISVGASFGVIPAEHWCFVSGRYMGHPQINNYYINNVNNTTIINNTTVINNTYNINKTNYYSGPGKREVEKVGGVKLPVMHMNDVQHPENAGITKKQLNIYRPAVNEPARSTVLTNNKTNNNNNVAGNPVNNERKQNDKSNKNYSANPNETVTQQQTKPFNNTKTFEQRKGYINNNHSNNLPPTNNRQYLPPKQDKPFYQRRNNNSQYNGGMYRRQEIKGKQGNGDNGNGKSGNGKRKR